MKFSESMWCLRWKAEAALAGGSGMAGAAVAAGTKGTAAVAVTGDGRLKGVRPCSGTEPEIIGASTLRLMLPRGTTTTN